MIAEKTLSLLRECAARGLTIVIATGRLYYSVAKYVQQIGLSTKVLCYNGCLVTEADSTPIFEDTTIDPDLDNTTAIESGDFDDYEFLSSPKAMIAARPEEVPLYHAQLKTELRKKTIMKYEKTNEKLTF